MKHHPLTLATLLATLLLAHCGKESESAKDGNPATGTASSEPASTPPVKSDLPLKKIEITANDQMKFSQTQLEAAAGQPLVVTLKNLGTMPKASMGHNWVLLTRGADANKIMENGMTAAGNGYIPKDMENLVIARTELLGPGESDTVTFNAPSEPGDYEFICSFPGHYLLGMKGILTVK
jgi:azurin